MVTITQPYCRGNVECGRSAAVAAVIGALLVVGAVSASPVSAAGISLSEGLPVIHGFAEGALGVKLCDDQTKHDGYNLAESRLQLKTRYYPELERLQNWQTRLEAKVDFWADAYFGGKTGAEVRLLNAGFTPGEQWDIKVGRQVLTWGTGEYVFINDVFPKDYISFYSGREDEYLKKPSDAVRVSVFGSEANADLVIIPSFTPNTIFDGDRMSFFDPFQGGISGTQSDRYLSEPESRPENYEFASRLYRTFGSYESALYFYRGYYKNPVGYLDEAHRVLFYPRLDVYGASIRGPGWGGIVNLEGGFYHSRQDTHGDNRLVQNSQAKVLVGYSRDLGNDWSLGVQYLLEQTQDYEALLAARLPTDTLWDKYRQVTTCRLTKLYRQQSVRAQFFIFYSPSEQDIYLRPSIGYDITDQWNVTAGANLSWGKDDFTEFGQTRRNKNIYGRARYSF